MKMKKLLSLSLASLLLLSLLYGCKDFGSGQQTEETSPTPSPSQTDDGQAGFDYSAVLTDEGFLDGITAGDYVTLPQYKGVSMLKETLEADETQVQSEIDSILADHAEYAQITDRAVEDGDTVNIDYVGSVDGVEFENGSTEGNGTDVTIGVTQYVDDFLEQIVGHMPGETFQVYVTFPEDYQEESLQSKDAVFEVTVNYIQGDAAETELTQEIAEEYGYGSVDELMDGIREWTISNKRSAFTEAILAGAQCADLPQGVLDYVINMDMALYEQYAVSYGVDIDTFFQNYIGYDSKEAYLAENDQTYRDTAVKYLAVQAIAEAEGLSVTDADITEAGLDDYEADYGRPYLKMYVLQEVLVPKFIIDNAVQE